MEQYKTRKTKSLRDFLNIFISRFWIITGAALLAFLLVLGYTLITYTPMYTSTATVYLLRQDGDDNGSVSSSDFSLALSTVNDCTVLLTSHNVLDKVIENLGMPITYSELKSMISIQNPDSTRVLMISITTDTNPGDAKTIVDELCRIGAQSITHFMGINQVNIIDEGTYSEQPSNSKFSIYPFLAGIITGVLVFVIYLIIFILDDKINTEEDVNKYLGLNVLGYIPNRNDVKAQNGKHSRYSADLNKTEAKNS